MPRRYLWLLSLFWLACSALALPLAVQAVDQTGAAPLLVWVNIPSHIYHYPGSRWYGRTNRGKYLTEAEALAEGDRAALNEHRPAVPTKYAENQPVGILRDGSGVVLLPTPGPGERALAALGLASAPPSPSVAQATPAPTVPPELQDGPGPQVPLSTCLTAIAAQSDPAKLATLGTRGANPRLKRIMYYLAQARQGGADPSEVIHDAQRMNRSAGTPRAALVKAGVLRNLKICDGLGLLTPENMAALRRGNMPTVTRGPYIGQGAEVDHIVPLAIAPEIGNELANLEMLPGTLNRAKSTKVGERQLALAKKFRDAGMISEASMARVQVAFRPAGTQQYELTEP